MSLLSLHFWLWRAKQLQSCLFSCSSILFHNSCFSLCQQLLFSLQTAAFSLSTDNFLFVNSCFSLSQQKMFSLSTENVLFVNRKSFLCQQNFFFINRCFSLCQLFFFSNWTAIFSVSIMMQIFEHKLYVWLRVLDTNTKT